MQAKQPPAELDVSVDGAGYYLDDFGGVLVQASKIYAPDWKKYSRRNIKCSKAGNKRLHKDIQC